MSSQVSEDIGNGPTRVVPYRASRLVDRLRGACDVRSIDTRLFEHLDSNATGMAALREAGMATYRHSLLTRHEASDLAFLMRRFGSPLVLKGLASCAGRQCFRIERPADLRRALAGIHGDTVFASELLSGDTYNVHGIVTQGRPVRVAPPSRQLTGDPRISTRVFDYCGNVFEALDPGRAAALVDITHSIGHWLLTLGYRGVFGADVILAGTGDAHVVDLNPRFQASSLLVGMACSDVASIGEIHCSAFSGHAGGAADALPDARQAFDLDVGEAVTQVVLRHRGCVPASPTRGLRDGVYRPDSARDGTLQLINETVRIPLAGEVVVLDAPSPCVAVAADAAVCRCWSRVDLKHGEDRSDLSRLGDLCVQIAKSTGLEVVRAPADAVAS
jgi:hypothetical protein